LAHRVIEYVEDGLAQPSEPSIPTSIGRVTSRPRPCRAHQQVGDEVDFPSSFGHRQWMLHPVDADFEATTLQDSAKRTRLITDPGSHGSHRRERGGQDGRRCALRACW
jgi:hypothetical protein